MAAVDQVFKEESMGRVMRVSLGSLFCLLCVQSKEGPIFRIVVSQSATVVEACSLGTWEHEARLSYTVGSSPVLAS